MLCQNKMRKTFKVTNKLKPSNLHDALPFQLYHKDLELKTTVITKFKVGGSFMKYILNYFAIFNNFRLKSIVNLTFYLVKFISILVKS